MAYGKMHKGSRGNQDQQERQDPLNNVADEPTYEETIEEMKSLGIKKGMYGDVNAYLVSDEVQFEATRRHVRAGRSNVHCGFYPTVYGGYKGCGWYVTRQVPQPRHDDYDCQIYDYLLDLLLPFVKEVEWL